jgi:hypothetical protein
MQGHLQSFCWKGADRPFQIHPGGIVEELQCPLALRQVQQNWRKLRRQQEKLQLGRVRTSVKGGTQSWRYCCEGGKSG